MMALRPKAPARAHRAASSLILVTKSRTEGWALSKTQSLRCFHTIQGTSRVAEASPLCIGLGVSCRAARHQQKKNPGERHVSLSQESTSCHICQEKGQARRRCCIVSGSWSQRGQRGGCCRPRRASRSAVQQRSRSAVQQQSELELSFRCFLILLWYGLDQSGYLLLFHEHNVAM